MKTKDEMVLNKIAQYADQIEEAYRMFNGSKQEFLNSSVFRNACCMCILQIGELCKVLSDEAKSKEPSISWKDWCGIRDIFAHQYENLDIESAWDTIIVDLPQLKDAINRMK